FGVCRFCFLVILFVMVPALFLGGDASLNGARESISCEKIMSTHTQQQVYIIKKSSCILYKTIDAFRVLLLGS
ncbi:MAG: hypothetical protein Q4C86_13440, partial [bacterium]|nr:hypothetical protein [bacterium]